MGVSVADCLADTRRFYQLLDQLAQRIGGPRQLAQSDGRMGWPQKGLYFFFEQSETRSSSGIGPRVVRIGTHALAAGSSSTLWGRLSNHRGTARSQGGNHRGSIFRLLVGIALAQRCGERTPPSWGIGSDLGVAVRKVGMTRPEIKRAETRVETQVSQYIGGMPLLWLGVDDKSGPDSDRGQIERNAIALLSNFREPAPDPASVHWLGHFSDRERVRSSGLWNNNHVDEEYDPTFLEVMGKWVERASPSNPLGG